MNESIPIRTINPAEFVEESAKELKNHLEQLLEQSETITVALSGGSSPLPIYEKLSTYDLDWDRILFFLVDERCVAGDSPENNYRNINEVFFSRIPSKSFPVITPEKSCAKLATKYQKKIEKYVSKNNNIPSFDLMVLGMGLDGHTASLFPETSALKEEELSVVLNRVPNLKAKRITLTYPVIMNSKKLVLLIKGEEKKKVLLNAEEQGLPIAKVLPNIDLILN